MQTIKFYISYIGFILFIIGAGLFLFTIFIVLIISVLILFLTRINYFFEISIINKNIDLLGKIVNGGFLIIQYVFSLVSLPMFLLGSIFFWITEGFFLIRNNPNTAGLTKITDGGNPYIRFFILPFLIIIFVMIYLARIDATLGTNYFQNAINLAGIK